MVKGEKVYDPLNDKWSMGWWLPVYNGAGYIMYYLPIWRN